ncbi:hypothetical protein GCM10027614_23830 [Micromonospora vulcania]
MTGALLAGLVAGYGVAIPVGAIAVLILGLSARTSFRVGAAGALGVATADGLYAAVAALGGAAVAGVVEPVAGPLRVVARRCCSRSPCTVPGVRCDPVRSPTRAAVAVWTPRCGRSSEFWR